MPISQQIHILHLEDSPRDAELIHAQLSAGGLDFDVALVDTKEQYLAALAKDAFDLILVDYNMPGYSGIDLVYEALSIQPLLPIALASGYITAEIEQAAMAAGARALVHKPNDVEELCATVHRLLNERWRTAPPRHWACAPEIGRAHV